MCSGGASLINSGLIQFSTGGLFDVSKASIDCLCTSGLITPGLPNCSKLKNTTTRLFFYWPRFYQIQNHFHKLKSLSIDFSSFAMKLKMRGQGKLSDLCPAP